MANPLRRQSKIETRPWLCTGCGSRFETLSAYQGHLGAKLRNKSIKHEGIPRKIEPSARKGKKLPLELMNEDEEESSEEFPNLNEKVDPQTQRERASKKPRHSVKNMPQGWTKEKIVHV